MFDTSFQNVTSLQCQFSFSRPFNIFSYNYNDDFKAASG